MTLIRPGADTVTLPKLIGIDHATMIYTAAYSAGRHHNDARRAREEARDALLHFAALAVEPIDMEEPDAGK